MLRSRFTIIFYRFLSVIFLSLLLSCSKKKLKMVEENMAVPQHNSIAENMLINFKNSKHIESIVKFICTEDRGIIFLGRKSDTYYLGKLSAIGNSEEFLYELDYIPSDMVAYYSVDANQTRMGDDLFVSGNAKDNSSPAIYRYAGLGKEFLEKVSIDGLSSINSIYFSITDKRIYFGGNNQATQLKVYSYYVGGGRVQASEKLDSFELSPQVNSRNIRKIDSGIEDATIFVLYDSASVGRGPTYAKVDELNYSTRKARLYAMPDQLFRNPRSLIASGINSFLLVQTNDSLSTAGLFGYWLFRNGIEKSASFSLPSLSQYSVIYDVKILDSVIYACGISNCTDFIKNKSIAGNAVLLKITGRNVAVFTFGDASYLSGFTSMQISGTDLYLGGFSKQYFLQENNVQWFSNFHQSEPYLLKIPLDKLK